MKGFTKVASEASNILKNEKHFSKGIAKISLFVLALTVIAVSASFVIPALAAHTATVSLDKTFVRGGATDTYAFTVTNQAESAAIFDIEISIPTGFSGVSSVNCPSGWGFSSTATTASCTGNPFISTKRINAGESATISLSSTSATTEGSHQWSVQTQDTTGTTNTYNPTTTVDNTLPTVSTVTSDGTTYNIATSSPVTITTTFNEDISNTPTISVGGDSQTVNTCSDSDAKTFCFDYAVPAPTEATKTIAISNAEDLAGNVMNVDSSHTFNVDTIRPTATVSSDGQIFKADTHTITAIFSEAVKESPIPQIAIAYSGTTGICTDIPATSMTKTDTTHYRYDLTVDYACEAATGTVTISTAQDVAGNEMNTDSAHTFNVDTVAPVFTGTSPASNAYIKAGFAVGYTLSEAIASGTVKFNDGTTTQTYTMVSGDLTIGAHTILESALTGVTLVDENTYSISFDGTDAAGNPATTVTNAGIKYDTTKPTVVLSDNHADNIVKDSDAVEITATFTDANPISTSPAPKISLYYSAEGCTDISNADMTTTTDNKIWTYPWDVPAGSSCDGAATVSIVAQDAAGNPNSAATGKTSYTIDNTAPSFTISYYTDAALTTSLTNNYMKAGTYYIKITSNEPLSSAPTINVAAEGTANDVTGGTTTPVSGNDYRYTRSIVNDAAAVGAVPETIQITGTDIAGNTATNADVVGEKYTDTISPTVVLSDNHADNIVRDADTLTITATFTDAGTMDETNKPKITIGSLVTNAVMTETSNLVWTYVWDVPTSNNGPVAVSITAQDVAGNSNDAATGKTSYTIDNILPDAPTDITPSSPVFVNAGTYTIIGSAEANSLVQIYSIAAVVGSQQLTDGATAFSIPVPLTQNAINSFTVTAKDAAGNEGVAATVPAITEDSTNPTVALTYNPNRNVRDADTLTITATFTDTNSIDETNVPKISIDYAGTDADVTDASMTEVNNKEWTYLANIPAGNDGAATVTISAKDVAGNSNNAATNNQFTVDNTNPTVNAGTDKTTNVIFTQDATATDTLSGIKTYSWTKVSGLGLGTITFGTSNAEDTTISADTDGVYVIELTATDNAGNSASDTMQLIWDTQAPSAPSAVLMTVTMNAPGTVDTISGSDGAVEANAVVKVYDSETKITLIGQTIASANGAFSAISIGDNLYGTVYVTATDAAGNEGSVTPKLNDIVAPSAPTITQPTTPTNSQPITVSGTAETGSIVEVFVNGGSKGATNAIGGSFSLSGVALTEGTNTITAKATDAAGNPSALSSSVTVVLDTGLPTVSITSPSAGFVKGTVTITATAVDNTDGTGIAKVEFYYGTTKIGEDTTSTYSVNLNTVGLADGVYSLTAVAIDNAGNSKTSDSVPVTVDNTGPTFGTITITPSHVSGGNTYIPASATIKADVSDSRAGLNIATCKYTLNGDDANPTWSDANYNSTDSTCYASISTTSGAISKINIRVADALSNIGYGTVVTTTTDADAPVASNFIPANNGFTNDANPTISVILTDVPSGVDGSTITMTVGGATVTPTKTAITNGYHIEYTPTIPFADATGVAVSVSAKDNSGNLMTATTWSFTVDLTEPSIVSRTPGINAVGINPSSSIIVKFNELVNIDINKVALTYGTTPVTVTVSYNAATNEATIDPTTTLDSNKGYTITLSGVTDEAGNMLPTSTWSFTTATYYSISLTKGLNLLSLPIVPTSTAIANVLGSEKANIDTVWTYDAINDRWHMYKEGDNSSDLSTMTAGNGYWVSYTRDDAGKLDGWGNLFLEGANTPPQRTLTSGWNLIGYYQRENTDSVAASCALKTLRDPDSETSQWWTMLMGYDNQNKQFNNVGFNDNMNPGQGYWVFMTSKLNTYKYGPGLSAVECV